MSLLNKFCGNREEVMAKFLPESDFLVDLGCSSGRFLKQVQGKYKKAQGYDLEPEFIEKAKKMNLPNTEFFAFDLNNPIPIEDGLVDTVICSSTIEYLTHTENFLKDVYRVLKPEGIFIIEAPNIAFLPRRLKLLFGIHPHYNKTPTYQGYVLKYFTYSTLSRLLKEAGFTILKKLNSGFLPWTRALWRPLLAGDMMFVCQKSKAYLKRILDFRLENYSRFKIQIFHFPACPCLPTGRGRQGNS